MVQNHWLIYLFRAVDFFFLEETQKAVIVLVCPEVE